MKSCLSPSVDKLTVALVLLSQVAACTRPKMEQVLPAPALTPLEFLTTLSGDSITLSGIAPSGECRVFAVGAEWGSVLEIDLSSDESRLVGQLPGWIRGARLEPGVGSRVLVWSQGNSLIGWIDQKHPVFHPITPPTHPWGGKTVGPSVALPGGIVAVAQVGGRELLLSPRPWREAPLVTLLEEDGSFAQHLGRIPDLGGDYLSAALAQIRVGRSGDSLLVFHLSDARLDVFPSAGSSEARSPSHSLRFPQYFKEPGVWEDVWNAEWLENGAHARVYHAPQVAEVAFSPEGRVYAIRNGFARWRSSDSHLARRLFARPGGWEVTQQWLEVYLSRR